MASMGRPRSFDRDQAIAQAMDLFWQYGYESTSLARLKAGIADGISAPSFYAAFGSKEALFELVIERYMATHGKVNDCLWDDTLAPRAAVELALRRSARMQTERSHPAGCLLTVSTTTCPAEYQSIQNLLGQQRKRTRDGFVHCVRRAVAAGELAPKTPVAALASSLHAFEIGLTHEARDGVSGRTLEAAASTLMKLWDTYTV